MRKTLAICSLVLAFGAAGASAQQTPKPAPGQQVAKAGQEHQGKAKAKGHRTHKKGTNAAAAKTTGPKQTAETQTKEAKQDLKAAEKHLNKAEAAEKKTAKQAVKGAKEESKESAKAEAKEKEKATAPKHSRRHTVTKTQKSSY